MMETHAKWYENLEKYAEVKLQSQYSLQILYSTLASADPEGGTGGLGKSQVKWVSIGNTQVDPPPLETVGLPLEP